MTLSSLYILDLKGKVILSRDYRGDVPSNIYETFFPIVLEHEAVDVIQGNGTSLHSSIHGTDHLSDMMDETNEVKVPIFWHEGVGYAYVKVNNLYCEHHK
jgi:hypothetical protein